MKQLNEEKKEILLNTKISLKERLLHWKLMYEGHMISFQTFFVWAFKIVVDSWNIGLLVLYIWWDDWLIFLISGSNE